MHILLVNHYAATPDTPGPSRHYSFAKELVRRGYRVTIVASSFNHYLGRETRNWRGAQYQREILDGIQYVWVKTTAYRGNTVHRVRNMLSFAYSLSRIPNQVLGDVPELIYASSPHLFAAMAAERLSNRWGVPFVLEIRDLWPESLIALGDISRFHPFIILLGTIERYLYRRADQIVSLLPGAVDHVVAKGGNAERVTWIPNGIDLTMLSEVSAPRSKTGLVGIYAGSHGLANGLDLLLDAAYIIQTDGWGDRIFFRLIGDGPLKGQLIDKARRMGLTNVQFEDPVPKTEIYKRLAEADFFPLVLPDSLLYQWGISPNKYFDYMALGRPIVMSGTAPSNPVELSGCGIITNPGDANDFAKGIMRLARMSANERSELGARGRSFVEQYHSIPILVDKLERVFESAIATQCRA